MLALVMRAKRGVNDRCLFGLALHFAGKEGGGILAKEK